MTTTPTPVPESRTAVEAELTARLSQIAGTFVAELEAQGRLVEAGGAGVLDHLRKQVEDRQHLSEAYRVAVDTIVDDCGYPSDVAARIVQALQRRGLIPGEDGPEPQHERTPDPTPLSPASRGSIVVRLPDRETASRAAQQAPTVLTPVRVEGAVPHVRPAAAGTARPSDWNPAAAKAVTVAASLQIAHAGRLEVTRLEADGERVSVVIQAASLGDWEYWLAAIGARADVPTKTVDRAQIAAGICDGVAVHLTAHDVPELLAEARDAAGDPFYMWGRIYDLARGFLDQHDRVWVHLGLRDDQGMPLMLLRGGDSTQYRLGSIVVECGPLTAIDMPSQAAPAADAAGGSA
ncbi:BN159_2729 family protein [Streptomyces sp. NPDC005385]|uniref:BN159_2729 family protein n=1 Tax=Streptomyces sp. NPDC005385 TaxID=3157039 RepID=UPI0033A611C8